MGGGSASGGSELGDSSRNPTTRVESTAAMLPLTPLSSKEGPTDMVRVWKIYIPYRDRLCQCGGLCPLCAPSKGRPGRQRKTHARKKQDKPNEITGQHGERKALACKWGEERADASR